jgi:hypothetical protein
MLYNKKIMAQILKISDLIEKNAITRLSKDYENRLINKIKDNFNEKEQQIFVSSFYCFLNYDTKKDFIVDFDNAWKWTGFSRKDHAKTVLNKHFTIDIDYQVKSFAPEVAVAKKNNDITVFNNFKNDDTNEFDKDNRGGSNKETILLTVNTFKKFCLKAGTKKADEIHDYYIKLEELLHETLNEETNELRLQLTNTEKENEQLQYNLKNELVERQKLKAKYERFLDKRIDIDKFREGFCVYIIGCNEITDRFKIGFTNNLNRRLGDFYTEMSYNPIVYYIKYVEKAKFIESVIHHVLRKYRIYNSREWFKTDDKQIFIDALENITIFFENEDKKHENVIDVKIGTSNEETDNEDILSDEENDENIKHCFSCKTNLPFDKFSKNPNRKFGLDTYCKDCTKKKYKNSKDNQKIELSEKKCTKCDEIKDISEFYNRIGSMDGKTSECKDCSMDMYRTRIENREYIEVENKECLTCKKILDISKFGNKNDSPDGKMPYCKTCCSENAKSKRLIPKECSTSKKCNQCDLEKNIECFWNNKSNKDGKDNKCRECHKNNKSAKKLI